MSLTLKLVLIGILFLLMIITGNRTSKSGKPYPRVLFNIHKFSSLVTVALISIVVYNLLKATEPGNQIMILVYITAAVFLNLLITGGLLTLDKSFHENVKSIHSTLPVPAFILSGLVFYLLITN